MIAPELKQAIEHYCAKLTTAASNDGSPVVFSCDYKGRKYVRIVRTAYGSTSAHNFVKVDDGSLWKPAGWKGPAKNFSRGNVYTVGAVTQWHGR